MSDFNSDLDEEIRNAGRRYDLILEAIGVVHGLILAGIGLLVYDWIY